jgi:hypothetical protein
MLEKDDHYYIVNMNPFFDFLDESVLNELIETQGKALKYTNLYYRH